MPPNVEGTGRRLQVATAASAAAGVLQVLLQVVLEVLLMLQVLLQMLPARSWFVAPRSSSSDVSGAACVRGGEESRGPQWKEAHVLAIQRPYEDL